MFASGISSRWATASHRRADDALADHHAVPERAQGFPSQ